MEEFKTGHQTTHESSRRTTLEIWHAILDPIPGEPDDGLSMNVTTEHRAEQVGGSLAFQLPEKLKSYLQKAKAFVFAAEEDFGISIIEALSCGTPVIAFNRGGASETIAHGKTGIFFEKQDKEAIVDAVNLFESGKYTFDPVTLSNEARKYSKEFFEEKIKNFVEDKLHRRQLKSNPD